MRDRNWSGRWPIRYEIRVGGVLDDQWADWFGLQVGSDGDQTVMLGPVADQSALHGVLAKIRDLGLSLISVRPLGPGSHDCPDRVVMTDPVTLTPIGVVSGGRAEIVEDSWGEVISELVLDPAVLDEDATLGLAEFSHLEVVFHFHREHRVRRGSAYPRGNHAWPRVGVLAGHSPVRPNHLGVSRCALLRAEGLTLTVQGLDAIDGTPILDIKPYATGFQPHGPVAEPVWMHELMREYY